MIRVPDSFAYDSYVEMMKKFEKSGYRIARFKDVHGVKLEGPTVIARHDIDVSVTKALDMSDVEALEGIRSTYFVMLTSDAYNAMSKRNINALKKIAENGHEIGLHFDCKAYDIKELHDLKKNVTKELGILEDLIEEEVKSVSWHSPAKSMLGKRYGFLQLNGIANAYDPEYFGGYKYCSDSCMRWRDKPEKYRNAKKYPKVQIVTHPIWYSFDDVGAKEKVKENVLVESGDEVKKYLESIF